MARKHPPKTKPEQDTRATKEKDSVNPRRVIIVIFSILILLFLATLYFFSKESTEIVAQVTEYESYTLLGSDDSRASIKNDGKFGSALEVGEGISIFYLHKFLAHQQIQLETSRLVGLQVFPYTPSVEVSNTTNNVQVEGITEELETITELPAECPPKPLPNPIFDIPLNNNDTLIFDGLQAESGITIWETAEAQYTFDSLWSSPMMNFVTFSTKEPTTASKRVDGQLSTFITPQGFPPIALSVPWRVVGVENCSESIELSKPIFATSPGNNTQRDSSSKLEIMMSPVNNELIVTVDEIKSIIVDGKNYDLPPLADIKLIFQDNGSNHLSVIGDYGGMEVFPSGYHKNTSVGQLAVLVSPIGVLHVGNRKYDLEGVHNLNITAHKDTPLSFQTIFNESEITPTLEIRAEVSSILLGDEELIQNNWENLDVALQAVIIGALLGALALLKTPIERFLRG